MLKVHKVRYDELVKLRVFACRDFPVNHKYRCHISVIQALQQHAFAYKTGCTGKNYIYRHVFTIRFSFSIYAFATWFALMEGKRLFAAASIASSLERGVQFSIRRALSLLMRFTLPNCDVIWRAPALNNAPSQNLPVR